MVPEPGHEFSGTLRFLRTGKAEMIGQFVQAHDRGPRNREVVQAGELQARQLDADPVGSGDCQPARVDGDLTQHDGMEWVGVVSAH